MRTPFPTLTLMAVAALIALQPLKAIAADKVKFCVAGDSRGSATKKNGPINTDIIKKTLDAIKKEKPDFVIFSGDLVLGYAKDLEKQLTLWRDTFMKPLLAAKIPVYACRGNHDQSFGGKKKKKGKGNSVEDAWNKVFKGQFAFPDNGPANAKNMTYFIRDKNVLVFVFDNYTGKKLHQVDTKWMLSVIKKEASKPPTPLRIFAVCHEPAFALLHKDCLAVKPKQRDEFIKAFLKNGGLAFFCGHDHLYDHSTVKYPEGTFQQFVCGISGATLKKKWKGKYPDKKVENVKTDIAFGYLVVTVDDAKAEFLMKSWGENGKEQAKKADQFSMDFKKP